MINVTYNLNVINIETGKTREDICEYQVSRWNVAPVFLRQVSFIQEGYQLYLQVQMGGRPS